MSDPHSPPLQYLVTCDDGELLLTIWPAEPGLAQSVQVAPRVGPSSWGPPLPIRSLPPFGGAA